MSINIAFNKEFQDRMHVLSTKYGRIQILKRTRKLTIQELVNNGEIDLTTEEQMEYELFEAYKSFQDHWSFPLCNLEKYDWYRKYFHNIYEKTNEDNIVAHNGILCNKSGFFEDHYYIDDYNTKILKTVVLLKDKYRPNVDMSRDDIRQISLEMESDLEIICKQIKDQGFGIRVDKPYMSGYTNITLKKLWDILDSRPEFIGQLAVETDQGFYSIKELHNKLQADEKLELRSAPDIDENSRRLYDFLSIAQLLREFTLVADFSDYSDDIYISEKNASVSNDYADLFLPTFFIKPITHSDYLTAEDSYYRKAINAEHPLSRFIMDNCRTLNEHVPGIFHEMIRLLSEDDAEDIIEGINGLLQSLKEIPNGIIQVPESLQLTEKDFFELF